MTALQHGKNWRSFAEEGNANAQADSGRYESSQLPMYNGTNMEEGKYSNIVVNETDKSASFVYVIKTYPGNLQRSFEEARGLVINDYQNVVEEKWIESLKKKYPVKVNPEVFKSIHK
jgi:peptidyl-prolyl cis-trans isomerase SurA